MVESDRDCLVNLGYRAITVSKFPRSESYAGDRMTCCRFKLEMKLVYKAASALGVPLLSFTGSQGILSKSWSKIIWRPNGDDREKLKFG